MKTDPEKAVRELLDGQSLAVLATQGGGQPYTSLVAFCPSRDLKNILFATTRSTRKYANLSEQPRVALLVDNRGNKASDFLDAMAVTALGFARELEGEEEAGFRKIYLEKHPHLVDFISSPDCALFAVRVSKLYMVSRFQNVIVMELES